MGVFKGKCDGGVEGEDEKKKERKTDMDGEPQQKPIAPDIS